MTSQDKRKKLTVNERILLHILPHQRHSEGWEVPFALTQKGLALGVGIKRSEVPRSVKALKDQRLIYDERKHVIGDFRKHVVYFLTRSGLEEATRIRGQLARSGYEPQLYPVEAPQDQPPSGAQAIAAPDNFFGREEEMGVLKDAFSKERRPMVFIYGIAGSGKTTLVQNFIRSLGASAPRTIWHKCQPFDSLEHIVRTFLRQVSREEGHGDAHLRARELVDRLFEMDCIVVMDDLHKLPPVCLGLVEMMKDRLAEASSGPMFIFTSRDQLRLYDVRDVKIRRSVVEVELGPLDKRSAKEFIRRMLDMRKVGAGADVGELYKRTGGLPLSIEFLQFEPDPMKGSFRDFFKEEVISSLTPGQQRLAAYISTYRLDPEPRSISYCDPGLLEARDLEGLLSKRLIRRFVSAQDQLERLSIHEALRPMFAARATPAEAARYHAWCQAYYEEAVWQAGGGPLEASHVQALKELCHHQLLGGGAEMLLGSLPGYVDRLEQGGFYEDALMLLGDILEHTPRSASVTSANLLMLHRLRDRILAHWGPWDVFAEHGFFNRFLESLIGPKAKKRPAIVPVYEVKGRGVDKAQTLGEVAEAIRTLSSVGDHEGMVDLYLEAGWQSLFTTADGDVMEYLKQGANLARKVRPEAVLSFEIMRADVLFARGKMEEAMKVCKACLRSARAPSDVIFLHNLCGHIEFIAGASERASKCYSRALEASRSAGDMKGGVYSELHLMSVALLERGRPGEGLAEGGLRRLERLAETYRWFGDIYGQAFSFLVQAGAALKLKDPAAASHALDECIYLYSRADITSPTFAAGLKTLKYQIEGLEPE